VYEHTASELLSPHVDSETGTASQLLAADGPFADHLPGFAPRQEQIRLAEAIGETMNEGGCLVAEAGTGIGKTLAYLVPALQDGRKVIISTGTKNLQDQLYFRDLPLVCKALDSQASTALLKGRSNYLCLYRLEQARTEGRLPSREAVSELESVSRWSSRTQDGDLSNTTVISDESGLWPLVTSTPDNCLGSECPCFEDCFVFSARKLAQAADIVVVNHHLLFADMAVRQSGFGEVLPGASTFIVDEAHKAPETASQFFSQSLSARQVSDLCRDIMAEAGKVSGAVGSVRVPVENCRQKLRELQALVSEKLPDRGSWEDLLRQESLRNGLQGLDEAILDLGPLLKEMAGSSRGLEACALRQAEILIKLDRLDGDQDPGEVRWFERRGRGFALHMTPLDISTIFKHFREPLDAAWVFTSATLAVRGDFSHFTRQMGLEEARTLLLDSPFDYPNKAVLWIPDHLPEPRDPDYLKQVLDRVTPLLEASHGRAFLLFTSHRALRTAAELLAESVTFPLFVQGTQPRSLLLEAFRESGNGILLGTASFWEGVDVIGEALVLVVIDKLPFAAPDDPVMDARSRALRLEGGNPFTELFLPKAVISLKQGAGRLIRDVNDRGVLVICDPRIRTRNYGPVFLESLPPMRVANDHTEPLEFLQHDAAGD
jgi:ATP-dependent DNA helicase DinG